MQLNRIGRVLDVRWVAFSCCTVAAVVRSYNVHFKRKAADDSMGSRDKTKFAGLAKKLRVQFLLRCMMTLKNCPTYPCLCRRQISVCQPLLN